MKIVAFVPIKLNNERLPGKNIKCFDDGKPLLTYFLEKITQIEAINEFYVFCSDESVKTYLPSKVSFLKRPRFLDTKETISQDIIGEFVKCVDADIYCMCHCTNPFVSLEHFNETLSALLTGDFDSAFTAHKLQRLLWTDKRIPLNFDASNIPRTQDLAPLYDDTAGMCAFRKEVFTKLKRRIGLNPYITELSELESIDIDYIQDFILANLIYMNRKKLRIDESISKSKESK